METLFFAIMGWCGTKYSRRRYWLAEPDPVPWRPQPEPWKYAILAIVGIIVGIASGVYFNNSIANDTVFSGQKIIISGLFGLAVSNIVTGIASSVMKGKEVR